MSIEIKFFDKKHKNKYILSECDEGTPDAVCFMLDKQKHGVGDIAYKHIYETDEIKELKIVHIIKRSDDMERYNELVKDDDVLVKGEEKYMADTSAEFIFDEDCYLVWFKN